jgi:hypothetical protein
MRLLLNKDLAKIRPQCAHGWRVPTVTGSTGRAVIGATVAWHVHAHTVTEATGQGGCGPLMRGQSLHQLFIYFPILQNFPNFEIQLNYLAFVKKILKLYMRLDLNILSNVFNWVIFKFPTEFKL